MAETRDYVIEPVGFVRSSLKDRKGAPRQADEGAPEADIEILPAFSRALHRLRAGDEVIVLTWLHQAQREVLEVHPRNDPTSSLHGVFATRSPDRPNPIGLHRVTILALDGTRLRVSSIEAIDGTPVADIKPVLDPGRER